MKLADIVSRIEPLLRVAPSADAVWIRRLLTARESHDAFAALDNELFLRKRDAGAALLVASATRSEGRTTFALLLAVLTSALDSDRRVLLVDGDFDSGRLGRILGIDDNAPGLAEYFDGVSDIGETLHATALPNLTVAPVSRGSATPVRLAPRRFQSFVEGLGGDYDLVVFDTPAGGSNKAILSMASVVKSTLMVVKYGGPTREQVVTLMGDINRAGADVMGCVMNLREYVVPRMLYGQR